MSPARLLEHFDRLIDTPDAVPRLRRFILDLAVRGKLVEQDPKDEPAGELLKRIALEKNRLAKEGRIGKPASSPAISAVEMPFEAPRRWGWLRLSEIGTISGGMTPSKNRSDFWDGDINWFSPKDMKSDELVGSELKITAKGLKETGLQLYSPGCLFMVARSGILKRTFPVSINRIGAAANQDLKILCPFMNGLERYLQIMFKGMTDFILSDLVKTGTTVQSLKYDEFERQPFPIPPLAEQHRIVAKVDELMALCDELEAAQTKREKRRDRLVAATLHGLNNGDATATPGAPSTFEESARFYFNHLPRLTTRPEHIHQLRQTILNLAVRGKLIPQDPDDQPASQLIDEIRKEKRTLIGQGRIKKGKPLQELGNPDLFFDLPKGWSWVRLGELAKLVTSGSRDWAQHYAAQGAIFVRMGNLSRGSYHLRLNHVQRVKPPDDTEGARTKLEEGDLLVSITGDAGLLGLIPANFGEAYINQHTCLVRPMPLLRNRYLPELFRSPFAQDQFNEPQRGIKNSLRLTDVTEFLVPLPPLAEQHRIVAKLDELMALCDGLVGGIARTVSLSGASLEANLAQSLA